MVQEIINKYADMLFKLAYLRLQNVQDAEDVVQEVFYQYLKRGEGFADEEHEKAWLITVTLNACRKIWRSAWNRHRSKEDITIIEQSKADIGHEPEESMLEKERGQQIFDAVSALPVHYREVIHLFYYEELSIREIARVTSCKESTVTSQLTRGRELLRKKLKEDYDFA